ncbi:NAD(FAD)-dependent dehydrogenase [Thermanaerovibrio velox DSM 12556]|uniref:NAD(FAD)-dependent dehydrogenase n=1 Tax=Thermanaerovibrio velox DSM 12556 TaxID=926567 RepID=H0UPD0_9BACT|nr:FAD-dependent oxidoreductase [Thermanaerovibrio velox]EHM10561.1 NAD(FAD)-dependent dehydrogenase [Thermanaerovibrio velox DSM 12556]
MTRKVVVIGADAAGMSAASQLRRLDRHVEILVFERGHYTSYSACGIPYLVGGLIKDPGRLISRTPDDFASMGINVRTRSEVTGIDTVSRTVEVLELDTGRTYHEPYDQLLIATGAKPIKPQVEGIDTPGVFGVNTLDSGIELLKAVEERRPRKAVIIGGGYIGLEVAEALNCHRGLDVTVVERAPTVMGTLDQDMGKLVGEALLDVGVKLKTNEALRAVEGHQGWVKGVWTDQGFIEADIVVLGLGVAPNSDLAQRSRIPLGFRNSIEVDLRMRTPVEGIWAAGDCAQNFHMITRKPFYVAMGTSANKMGRVAGLNLAGRDYLFQGVMGTAVCKICKYEVARTGLSEREVSEAGIDAVSAVITDETRAGYYPGSGDITVKLTARKDTGAVIGGQIVGVEGAAKRIDVIATAIRGGLTAEDLVNMDLSYAPPFSPVWDPVQVATRALLKLL